jgi:hypothetical protein
MAIPATNGSIALTQAQREAIDALGHDEDTVPAPIWLARQAYVPNDALERMHADRDPAGFWRERASLVEWMAPFREVMRFDPPRHEWFVGGTLNATVSCIDRHVHGGRRNGATRPGTRSTGRRSPAATPPATSPCAMRTAT